MRRISAPRAYFVAHHGDIFDLIYVQRQGGCYGAIYSQYVEIALTGWSDCFAVRRYVYFSGKQRGISSELLGFNHAQELATGWFDPIFPLWVIKRDQKNCSGLVTTRDVS